MKTQTNFIIVLFASLLFLLSCDLYRDPEEYITYSDAYPICGEYYVRDYEANGTELGALKNDWYLIYIYNKSYNPTKDSIWINNIEHIEEDLYESSYYYRIKTKADTVNRSFNCQQLPYILGTSLNPPASPTRYITISESNIELKTWPEAPDSIHFKVTYYDGSMNEVRSIYTVGHRKTGWENPEYDDFDN